MPSRVEDQCCAGAGEPRPSATGAWSDDMTTKEDLVLRPKLDWRAALIGGALCLAYSCVPAVPAVAREVNTTRRVSSSAAAYLDPRQKKAY